MILSACERTEEINLEAPQNKFILCKGSSLYLNNGQKWTANKETTIGISKMQEQMGRVRPLPISTQSVTPDKGERPAPAGL